MTFDPTAAALAFLCAALFTLTLSVVLEDYEP